MTQPFEFPRSAPEAQGMPSSAVMHFLDGITANRLELHSLMLLRHGHVIAEGWWSPYAADRIHLLYSLSKSFASTAVGLAVAEGLLTVDDPVVDFFPDSLPASVSENLAAMRVHHLLCMGTGHVEDTVGHLTVGDDWIVGALGVPPEQAPGSIFTYNQSATFLLSAIVQKLTGLTLSDYLQPRLFAPLGIDKTYWQQNPQGINLGYTGLHVTTDAIARFGQLYLQKGLWDNRQLLPSSWVEAATSVQIDSSTPDATNAEEQNSDWVQGYGYQFWRCRHNAYRGDGAFGQFCLVMPEEDAVLAVTSGTEDMQGVLNQVWAHLLPALGTSALPADPATYGTLRDRLANLAYAPVAGEASSPQSAAVDGAVYRFAAGPAIQPDAPAAQLDTLSLTTDDGGYTLTVTAQRDTHAIRLGVGSWREGTTTFMGSPAEPSSPIVASCGWTADDTLTLAVRYIETPHALAATLRFDGETVELNGKWNVAFGPINLPTQVGKHT